MPTFDEYREGMSDVPGFRRTDRRRVVLAGRLACPARKVHELAGYTPARPMQV
ncbi:MAG: hypothetical protein M0Z42_17815 [Actinomycetota bacterium]|jgi:hypothetical protein|nr:hypothetical protein [Actinomycetota bacterium]